MNPSEVGSRLKLRRLQKEMTQQELASALHDVGVQCDTSNISRIERGRAGEDMSYVLLRGFARVLDTPIDWLAFGPEPDFMAAVQELSADATIAHALTRLGAWYSVAGAADRVRFAQGLESMAERFNRHYGTPALDSGGMEGGEHERESAEVRTT